MNNALFQLCCSYKCGKEHRELMSTCTSSDGILSASMSYTDDILHTVLTPSQELTLESVSIRIPFDFYKNSRIMLNGYQSWTDTREFSPDEKMRGLNSFIRKNNFFGSASYGDYNFAEYPYLHGFSYGYVRTGDEFTFLGSLNERTGYTVIYALPDDGLLIIEKDCSGLAIDSAYNVFDIFFSAGSEDEVFDKYFSLLSLPAMRTGPKTGYTTWYNHYANINEDVILSNLDAIKNSGRHFDVFQIDDGFQTATGDWLSIDKKKFPNGLAPLAEKIKDAGMIPGLWLAPFAAQKNSELRSEHPDWCRQYAGSNWGGFYALDAGDPQVREYIKHVFDVVINEWGFGLLKLDFLYAACLEPVAGKTRGQMMCEAMDLIRECAGDAYILGCGVPLWPAFGKADFCRIGCDVSLNWSNKSFRRIANREIPSTKITIENTVFRRHLSGKVFWNDPDVFMIRSEKNIMTKKQRDSLCTANALFGDVLFTSDDLSSYDDNMYKKLDRIFELKDAEVLDIKYIKDSAEILIRTKDGKKRKEKIML